MTSRTLVLLDPSEPDGDSGMAELMPCDEPVTLTVLADSGTDALAEIFAMFQDEPVNRVVVPPSLPGLGDAGLSRLMSLCPVPVVVTAAGDHSGEWQTASTLLPSGSRTNAP